MLQFMRNNKGALSVFTLFILIPVMIFSGLLIDFARAMTVRAQAAATAETYANSYLSMYDEMLNELYGLFAVTQSKEGMEAVTQLEAYMKASYAPNSLGETHIENANALGIQNILKSVFTGNRDGYSEALPLTGNAFSSIKAEPSKPLIDGNDYDALQMQISEYVKFIGPTDLIATGVQSLIKPESDKLKNEANQVEQTNKNFERIKKKAAIDDEIGELNNQITTMYTAMEKYDTTLTNYYNSIKSYSNNSINTYLDSLFLVTDTYDQFKKLFQPIDNAGTASGYESQLNYLLSEKNVSTNGPFMPYKYTNFDYLSDSFKQSYELYDYEANLLNLGIINGQIVNSNLTEEYRSYYTENKPSAPMQYSYADVVSARNELISTASKMEVTLESIKTKIQALINEMKAEMNNLSEEEKKNTQSFIEGLEKDYEPILNYNSTGSGDQRKMWVVANFEYKNMFSNEFNEEAEDWENDLIDDFDAVYDDNLGVSQYDDYLEDRQQQINKHINSLLQPSIDDTTLTNIKNWIEKTDSTYTVNDDDGIYKISELNSFFVFFKLPYSSITDYYTPFDKRTDKKDSHGISYQELYNTLKEWNTAPSDGEESEKKARDLEKNLLKLIDEVKFDNIKLRTNLENKIMPTGLSTADDANAEKSKLENIIDDNPNGLGSPDVGEEYLNKLLLMMYDYGMFTCQTSDKEIGDDDKVKTVQPYSYQGIALAKSTGTGQYEASETNFLLYGELEYIFNGNADPQKNFNAVRNSLSVIRFVPNYISTYTITEINSIINSIQTALAWCPLVAIGVAQLVRIALASFETWCDLDLLYGGHSILFYKNSLSDLSLLTKIKNTTLGQEVYGTLNEYSGGALDSADKKASISDIKINYSQYLIILQMIFVSRDDMIKRTADLIETNMSYIKGKPTTLDNGMQTVECTYKLSSANTAVTATCTVKNNFIFIGGVMNADAAGYSNATELANKSKDKLYDYSVTCEY